MDDQTGLWIGVVTLVALALWQPEDDDTHGMAVLGSTAIMLTLAVAACVSEWAPHRRARQPRRRSVAAVNGSF